MQFKSTVLIVDDQEVGRETLEDLLITQDYRLVFASDGREAITKAIKFTPDIILLDIMMPDMDGFEVCRQLRADSQLAEVPVVIVTALDDRDSRLRGIEAGADDFISKPFDRTELRARVKSIIRLNRYRRLLTERNKFEWAVEQANEGYLTLGDQDQILYANPQARFFLDLPLDKAGPITETFLNLTRKQYYSQPQDLWLTWPRLPDSVNKDTPRYLVRPETPTAKALWLQVDLLKIDYGLDERYMVRLYNVSSMVKRQTLMWSFHLQVSHKLRTPITVLTGFLEVANEDAQNLSEAELRSFLLLARKHALILKEHIESVFHYLESSRKVELDRDRCNLTHIAAIITEVKTGLALDVINFSYQNIENPETIYVTLPRRNMELILWELLENAQKFHPAKKPTVDIEISSLAQGVQIQICDNGQNLSPETLSKIWIPYYQGEKYFTGQMLGMGLGLAMVTALVWRVGGTCRIDNRAKSPGVVIKLLLPIKENEHE